MSKNLSKQRSTFWLTVSGFALLGLLLYSKRDVLGETGDAIKNADIRYILLLPVLQATSFLLVGKYYQSMFALFNSRISSLRSWGVVAALNFVNQILPSGGASGLTYLAYGFKDSVKAGVTGLVQLGRYLMSMTTYVILTPITLWLVYLSGQGSWLKTTLENAKTSPEALGFGIGFAIIIFVAYSLFRSRDHSHKYGAKFEVWINSFGKKFLRKTRPVIKKGTVAGMVGDFHDGFEFIKGQKVKALKPFMFMVLSTLVELTIVYTAFKAVGGDISIGVLFFSFIAANIAGVVSIIPGDVGVHEGAMILMLSTLGIDDHIAISATLLYRIFNKMIFLPIGFYFYTKLLKPAKS